MYADDTKIYREIKSEFDHGILQRDLENLKTWSDRWQAHVQEFARGGGPKSESLFFFFCFSLFQGGGPAQKLAEKNTFSTKKGAKYR